MGAGTPGRPPSRDRRRPLPSKGDGKGNIPDGLYDPPLISPAPPKDDGRPGIRPPKEIIFPIEGRDPVKFAGESPKGGKGPEVFDKLLEGVKRAGGLGGQGKPFGGRRPAPGSDIPLGTDDRPLPSSDPFSPEEIKPKIVRGPDDRPVEVWPWGREDDPDYDRKKKEYFEKKMGPMPKSEPFGTGPRPPRPFEMREPDFMSGPGRGRPPRGTKKEAVVFRGRSPSTESRRPTKESPKRGMRKAGPINTETKNKFEEMLAYMKSFQR